MTEYYVAVKIFMDKILPWEMVIFSKKLENNRILFLLKKKTCIYKTRHTSHTQKKCYFFYFKRTTILRCITTFIRPFQERKHKAPPHEHCSSGVLLQLTSFCPSNHTRQVRLASSAQTQDVEDTGVPELVQSNQASVRPLSRGPELSSLLYRTFYINVQIDCMRHSD